MSGADKRHPIYRAFMSASADAIMTLVQGEKERVLKYVEQLGVSSAVEGYRLSKAFWRRHARYHQPSPEHLIV